MTDRISPKQFHESEGVEDWRVIGDGACAYFPTASLWKDCMGVGFAAIDASLS
jgi:hypothetical protein